MKYYDGYEGPEDVEGYVYLFKCGDHYKIGYSKHPIKRRKQLSTGAPLLVEYVHTFWTPFCRQIEKRLHRKFSEKRGRGEWFTLSEADVAHIKTIDKWGMSEADRTLKKERERQYEERRRQEELGAPSRIEAALMNIERRFRVSAQ